MGRDKNNDDEDDSGSKSGEIEFRLQNIAGERRDDMLSEPEIRRLLITQEAAHKNLVDKQKATRKERDNIKNNPAQTAKYGYDSLGLQAGGNGGGASPYKTHPISQHAQFSGATDHKVTGVPTDNIAQTNDEARQKLEERLELQLGLKNQLKHTHKLSSAPTLRRQ
jgi:hypothetical protein